MVRILVGGDVNASGINSALFERGDAAAIFGELLDEFRNADLSMVNLEAPLIREPHPVAKSGSVLGVDHNCIKGIVNAGIHVVGLANNHTMDHGMHGLRTTIDRCAEESVLHVGAGDNLATASLMLVEEVGGLRVGIVAVCEHEFGIATTTAAGVCPLDPINFVRTLRDRRDQFDYLIVLVHGGNEYFRYPRPSLRDTCWFLVEEGADLVVCQHSHISGCHERYRNGQIVYGQGNLVCAASDRDPFWYEGFLITVDVDAASGDASDLRLVPFVQSEGSPGCRPMVGERRECFLGGIAERSAAITDPAFVESAWHGFCDGLREHYLRRNGGLHRVSRILDRLTGYIQYFYRRPSKRLEQLNLIRCESHREALINILSRDDW